MAPESDLPSLDTRKLQRIYIKHPPTFATLYKHQTLNKTSIMQNSETTIPSDQEKPEPNSPDLTIKTARTSSVHEKQMKGVKSVRLDSIPEQEPNNQPSNLPVSDTMRPVSSTKRPLGHKNPAVLPPMLEHTPLEVSRLFSSREDLECYVRGRACWKAKERFSPSLHEKFERITFARDDTPGGMIPE
ncbi:hypothetical protein K491DRAFT_736772 [Lophiostoma macrostomum CBS 122681]|uniref:Uncharacterized protein n=1 Tax=Lophiostoma macrostomum CBS 122681 TaxID=1314788 RepID=A0A6A6SQK7_9PLEO|nr:hypothetical protein K491DRAFT_736772 [Lophiostoma macrostomum CBS 122681]